MHLLQSAQQDVMHLLLRSSLCHHDDDHRHEGDVDGEDDDDFPVSIVLSVRESTTGDERRLTGWRGKSSSW